MILKWKHLIVAVIILSFMASVSAADSQNQIADNSHNLKVTPPVDDKDIADNTNKIQSNGKNTYKTAKNGNQTIKTTTTVDSVEAKISDNITLNATVIASDDTSIDKGYVIFKVNGQSLKDKNNKVIKVNVVDSLAQLKYTVPKSWNKDGLSISAVYSGSNPYNSSRSDSSPINVTKRVANLQLLTDKTQVVGGSNVTFAVVVLDDYTLLNDGIVLFKINGQTIKDKKGKNIQVNVKGGKAQLEYTYDYGISAKNTTVTAVYSNSIYERAETNTTIYINKSRPIINIKPVVTKTNKTKITASIVEFNGKPIKFTTQVAIKINGQTFAKVGAVNGKINVTIDTKFKPGIYELMIVAGENNRYLAQSVQTALEKK